jgi:hypothetical protein
MDLKAIPRLLSLFEQQHVGLTIPYAPVPANGRDMAIVDIKSLRNVITVVFSPRTPSNSGAATPSRQFAYSTTKKVPQGLCSSLAMK